jgi:glycosyltransferase involved in cell wall biosynthesis
VTRPIVGIDLRNFFAHPYATGVQRVLLCLLENWPEVEYRAAVLCSADRRTYFISAAAAARCIRACFEFSGEYFGSNNALKKVVADQFAMENKSETMWPEALFLVDRWLIAEPASAPALLRNWAEARQVMPTSLLFYDALPETNPEFFTPSEIASTSVYLRLAASMQQIVSISNHAADIVVRRLGNSNPGASLVALPGADHVVLSQSPAPQRTSFLVLSSVEKRKRVGVIIDAFREASGFVPNMELHIVGRRSSDGALVAEAEGGNSRIVWTKDANDDALAGIAATSTCLLSIGEEGYGLPALEMLRRGCPVVFAGTQPAAEIAIGAGAMQISEPSVQSVAHVMVHLANHNNAQAFRANIVPDRLPTWAKFAEIVASSTTPPSR